MTVELKRAREAYLAMYVDAPDEVRAGKRDWNGFIKGYVSALEGVAGLVEALEEALGTFRITQRPEAYPDEHWCNRATAALATFRGQGGR